MELLKFVEQNKNGVEEVSYQKGETIFFENDECRKVGIVKNGEITIRSFFASGKEVTYNTITKGQMFGNNLIFSSNPYYRGDVISETNSTIFLINKETLLKLLKEDIGFLQEYLTEQSDFSMQLNLKIKLLTISSAEDRLIYYLTFNKRTIRYKSITKLANELFLTRETLSRTIRKLVDKKIITNSQKTLALIVK